MTMTQTSGRERFRFDLAARGLTAWQTAQVINTVRWGRDCRGCSKGRIYELLLIENESVWSNALIALEKASTAKRLEDRRQRGLV